MIIALDFDDTYTRDPDFWNTFLEGAKERSHIVFCVTMRYEHEAAIIRNMLGARVCDVICTGRKAKKDFLYKRGIHIDIWIDDTPGWILHDAADAIPVEELCEECGCDMSGWTQHHSPDCNNLPY